MPFIITSILVALDTIASLAGGFTKGLVHVENIPDSATITPLKIIKTAEKNIKNIKNFCFFLIIPPPYPQI
ncbi:MAG: hypothetical protein ACXVHS_08485 [Methanobacterium sp.]